MDASHLSKLPAELRNKIYECVLYHQGPISILIHTGQPTTTSIKTDDLAITKTCRQLRHESLDVFYSINTFTLMTKFLEVSGTPWRLEARRSFDGMRQWLMNVNPDFTNRLNRLCIDLGWFSIEGNQNRVTESMEVARIELQTLKVAVPTHAVFVRAAYFVEVFPPIGVTMRYIDVPLGDREKAVPLLESTTSGAKAGLPGYAANRADVEQTMDLFMHGVQRMIF